MVATSGRRADRGVPKVPRHGVGVLNAAHGFVGPYMENMRNREFVQDAARVASLWESAVMIAVTWGRGMKMIRTATLLGFAGLLTLVSSAGAQLQKTSEGTWVEPWQAEVSSIGTASASPDWGTSATSSVSIPAADFSPRPVSTALVYGGNGYVRPYDVAPLLIWAPIELPAGSLLESVRVAYRDSSHDRDIELWVTRYLGDSGSPTFEDLAYWSSSGYVWYAAAEVPVGATINYRIAANQQSIHWVVVVELEDPETQFKGVLLNYKLQVSPAPAQATFSDVPLSHPFSQYVEALAASGITAGCGQGKFCPDSPLTRGEMAVFLAKALGLHWPS